MPKIALAIGHNFAKGDRGAVLKDAKGVVSLTEADMTKKIIDSLIRTGMPNFILVKVPENLGIIERNKWVNKDKTIDLYLELHLDSSSDPKATGCTAFFKAGNKYASGEATQFHNAYQAYTGIKSRGVHGDNEDRLGRLGAIHDINALGILYELGFISNPSDLQTIKLKAFDAIKAGIQAMFAN